MRHADLVCQSARPPDRKEKPKIEKFASIRIRNSGEASLKSIQAYRQFVTRKLFSPRIVSNDIFLSWNLIKWMKIRRSCYSIATCWDRLRILRRGKDLLLGWRSPVDVHFSCNEIIDSMKMVRVCQSWAQMKKNAQKKNRIWFWMAASRLHRLIIIRWDEPNADVDFVFFFLFLFNSFGTTQTPVRVSLSSPVGHGWAFTYFSRSMAISSYSLIKGIINIVRLGYTHLPRARPYKTSRSFEGIKWILFDS